MYKECTFMLIKVSTKFIKLPMKILLMVTLRAIKVI